MTNKPTSKRGGPRPGAGRPKGSGTGRKVRYRTITLPADYWALLDSLKGEQSASKWIKAQIEKETT